MNKVEQAFIDSGNVIMQPGQKWFVMSKSTAIEFIEACRNEGIGILGIDGFYLHENGIRPSLENSIDYSSAYYNGPDDLHNESIEFLNGKENSLYFEVVCSDISSH